MATLDPGLLQILSLVACLVTGSITLSIVAVISRRLLKRSRYVFFFGAMMPLIQLSAIYFLFPLPVILSSGQGYSHWYGIEFSSFDIFYVQVIVLMVSALYLIAFRYGFGPASAEDTLCCESTTSGRSTIWVFFISFLLVDVALRVSSLYAGTYFSWMRSFAEPGAANTRLFQIVVGSFTPLLAALAVHLSRQNRITLIYLVGLLAMVLAEGRRTSILLAVFSASAVFVLNAGFPGKPKKKFGLALLSLFFLYFSFSVVLEVRSEFRSNISYALDHPVSFVIGETVKSSAEIVGLSESNDKAVDLKSARLSDRSVIQLITFASVARRYFDGYELLPFDSFIKDTKRVVPSVIVGQKDEYSAGNALANQFQFSATGTGHADPGSSYYQAIFAIFGLPGVALLASFCGLAFGVLFKFIAIRYRGDAWAISAGLVGIVMVNGNSYSAALANIRHLILLLAVMWGLGWVFRLLTRKSTR